MSNVDERCLCTDGMRIKAEGRENQRMGDTSWVVNVWIARRWQGAIQDKIAVL